jgi:hypothetical protein
VRVKRKALTAEEQIALNKAYQRHVAACLKIGAEPAPIEHFITEYQNCDYTQLQPNEYTRENLSEGLEQCRYRQYVSPKGDQ